MRDFIQKQKKRGKGVVAAMALFWCRARITYATSEIIKPINNLKTLLTDVVGAIGAVIIVKNIFELASAIQQNDTASTAAALKGLAGGFLMASISAVLKFLGV